jgi:hypothetical protein
VSRSRLGSDDDEDVQLPRDTTGRNVLLVLLVAVLTFLLTFAIVKLRQHVASPGPEVKPAAAAVLAPTAQALHPAAAVAVPPAVTTPLPLSAQAPATAQPPPAAPLPAAAKGLGVLAPRTGPRPRKPARSTAYDADPPAHLKGELLPITP